MLYKVYVSMLGARMHYAVPRLLDEAGLLGRFYTDSYAGNKPALARLIRAVPERARPKALRRWLGRAEPALAAEKVTSFELFGWRYATAQRRAGSVAAVRKVYADFAREFDARVIRHMERAGDIPSAVWGFNGASLGLFEWARARGVRCILEQTIAPHAMQRDLLARELERWPGWQPGFTVPPAADGLAEREQREWALADVIVGGSAFVTDGLIAQGVPTAKCRVVPYGVDISRFGSLPTDRAKRRGGPLRVLFAGEVGLRKGAPYLLEALARLGSGQVQARFAGRVALARDKLAPYAGVAEFLGAVPRSQMAALYAWADVFCLPSVCEGSATVTYEALMCGLPVVTTPNAGSVIRDGQAGWLVPVGDVPALVQALQAYADNPALLTQHAAHARALRDFTGLRRYGQDLVKTVNAVAGQVRDDSSPAGTKRGAARHHAA